MLGLDVNAGLLAAMGVSFVSGLILAFAPCCFPSVIFMGAYVTGKKELSRKQGFFISLCFVSGMIVILTTLGLVTGGIIECIIIGWILKATVLRKHINNTSTINIPVLWNTLIKFITPGILLILVYFTLKSDIAENYGGYPSDTIFIFGIGWIVLSLIAALIFTYFPWKPPTKLTQDHKPEDEEILT